MKMQYTQQEGKPMLGFWRNWITGWCLAVGMFGIILAGGGLEVTSGPSRIIFDLLNGPGELELDPHMRFSLAVLGAVSIGWSLTLLAAVQALNLIDKQLGKPIWVLVIASVMSWYVIDSILSIATGFGLNTIPNTVLMAGFLIPVIRSGVFSD
jgi:hypothetical protein